MKRKKLVHKVSYAQLRDPEHGGYLECWTYGGRSYPTPPGMPSEVNIYGQTYKIYYHSKIYAEKKKRARLLGIVTFAQRIIFLEPNVTVHLMREALYHEIAHVYVKIAQTRSPALSKLSYQQVEDICDTFGESILDLARNNEIRT